MSVGTSRGGGTRYASGSEFGARSLSPQAQYPHGTARTLLAGGGSSSSGGGVSNSNGSYSQNGVVLDYLGKQQQQQQQQALLLSANKRRYPAMGEVEFGTPSVAGFDSSDFPSLSPSGANSTPGNGLGNHNNSIYREYNDEFPALFSPSSSNHNGVSGSAYSPFSGNSTQQQRLSQHRQQQQEQIPRRQQQQRQTSTGNSEQQQQQQQQQGREQGKTGTNLGSALANLSLNLNSTDSLYMMFSSSSSSSSWGSQNSESWESSLYHLPECYPRAVPVSSEAVLAYRAGRFTEFKLDTLLYAFYAMPQDAMQILAARELYTRGWTYHSELKLWFSEGSSTHNGEDSDDVDGRSVSQEPQMLYFDIDKWESSKVSPESMTIPSSGFMAVEEIMDAVENMLGKFDERRRESMSLSLSST